jgi:hypothetical protein
MPSTTPCAFIPYPLASDPPNFAEDMQALAMGVDTAVCNVAAARLPVGAIVPWYQPPGGGQQRPAGMLLCDGAAFSATSFPSLQRHLGTNVTPNLEGRFLRGRAAPYPGYGQEGGSNNSKLPSHKHTGGDHQHTIAHGHGASVTGDGAHAHGPLNSSNQTEESFMWRISPNQIHPNVVNLNTGGAGLGIWYGAKTTASATHGHGATVSSLDDKSKSGPHGIVTSEEGESVTNANLPPFTNVTYLIVAT